MGYKVTDETIRLNSQVNDLTWQERKLNKMASDLDAEIKRKMVQYGDLMLALGEVRTLLRWKEEELEKAVNS